MRPHAVPGLGRPALNRWRGRLASLVLVLLATSASGEGGEPAIAVIVGRNASPTGAISQTLVLGIFARKRQLWNDRSTIAPVNLPVSHPLRRNFSLWVFKKTPEQMQDYWNEQYFHGVLPPPVLASEEAVMRFVASTPGAIGYVSVCSIDKRVDVIALIQGPDGTAACPH